MARRIAVWIMARLLALVRSPMDAIILRQRGPGSMVIKPLRLFPDDAAPDETLQRAQLAMVLRGDKANGVAYRMGAARAANAMNVIFCMHREIKIHDMRNTVHINPARRDVRRHQHAYRTGLEILQRFEPLILRAV